MDLRSVGIWRSSRLVLLLLLVPSPCICSTHWMVTEDGKVQTVVDSLYNMAQSHDLVQFMRQEDRVHQAKEAQRDIDLQKSVINHQEKKDDPKIEEKLMQTDKDCLKAGKPLSQQDLFTSSALTVESFGIEIQLLQEKSSSRGKTRNGLFFLSRKVLVPPEMCPTFSSGGKSRSNTWPTIAKKNLRISEERRRLSMNQQLSADFAPRYELIRQLPTIFLRRIFPPEGVAFTHRLLGLPRRILSGDLPVCSAFYKLDFSMGAFEHLHSVRWRYNLSVGAERVLSPGVHPAWPNISDYGFAVAAALKEHPEVWWLHNMAILYWRVMGNATESVECTRIALHLAPRVYLGLPGLNLASILHQASRSKDAAQVMDTVLGLNETLPSAHCVAGDIYAVAIQYNKSSISFDRCLEIDPGFPGVRVRRAAVRCHQKLERALESQHENLQKTLSELQSYQSRLRNYQTLHEETYKNVADPETKKHAALVYDHFTYGTIKHLNCVWKNDNSPKYLNCVLNDESKYLSAKKKREDGLEISRSVKRNNASQNKVVMTPGSLAQPAPVDFDKEKAYLDALEPVRNLALAQPTLQRKYPRMRKKEWTSADYVFLNDLWPDEEDCKSNTRPLPSFRDFPHVFLSPRNKGFEYR